ncbi:MAG: hypothetical protein JWP75_3307 [Frondihabitans sp.]|nr:hypothetical protein [Frondihabitans sp.]
MSTVSPSPADRPQDAPADPLDAAIAPPTVLAKPGQPAWVGIATAMVFPLFFVVMFSLCYVSAFHAPAPHNAPLILIGQDAQTSAVRDGIQKQAPNSFDITTTTDSAEAINDIKTRGAIGAIEIGRVITAYTASANGGSTSQTVQQVAASIATQAKTTVVVKNLVPLASKDITGTGLFYYLIICTIGGYLTVTVLAQVGAKIRLRAQYLTVLIASVLVPVIEFGIASIFVGTFGASVGTIFGLLAVGAFYTLTVGTISLLANQIAGQASIFLVLTVAIFLNLPSAGGAIPYTFLPGFWQGLHSFWFGAGAMEAIRDVIYFNGTGMWPWLTHVAIWFVAALALSVVLGVRRAPNAATPTEALPNGADSQHRHGDHVAASA